MNKLVQTLLRKMGMISHMIGKGIRKIISCLLVLLLILLSGCNSRDINIVQELEPAVDALWMAGESPVPARRTALLSQCASTSGKRYECTNTGIYFLTTPDNYIIYADHPSDTFVPLCSRPDCGHADAEGKYYYNCNAYFEGTAGLCYFDGYLYVLQYISGELILTRVNADGTHRQLVLNLTEDISSYDDVSQYAIWNGVVTFMVSSIKNDGNVTSDTYYYKLDGTMKKPVSGGVSLPVGNDGDHFIGYTIRDDGILGYESWDPNTDTTVFLCEDMGYGYYGGEKALFVQDGVILQLDYESGQLDTLFETGLKGNYRLHCFPDCVVLSSLNSVDMQTGKQVPQVLYFYNWNFDFLGSVELDCPSVLNYMYTICGESHTQIYLATQWVDTPQYYIDKSEFGAGEIVLHKLSLPQLPLYEGAGSVANNG